MFFPSTEAGCPPPAPACQPQQPPRLSHPLDAERGFPQRAPTWPEPHFPEARRGHLEGIPPASHSLSHLPGARPPREAEETAGSPAPPTAARSLPGAGGYRRSRGLRFPGGRMEGAPKGGGGHPGARSPEARLAPPAMLAPLRALGAALTCGVAAAIAPYGTASNRHFFKLQPSREAACRRQRPLAGCGPGRAAGGRP